MTILKPNVPGTVIRFTGSSSPRIEPSAADTVAVPIVTDWGPIGADPPGTNGLRGGVQAFDSFDDFTGLMGDSDTAGRTAVAGAFAGQGLPGLPGAGRVLVYRMAGSSKAKATVTITDTSTAPALRLDALYYGSRANKFSYAIDVDPSNATRDRLRLFYNGVVRETYLYAQTDVVSLVNAINARSKLVVATNLESSPHRLSPTAAGATLPLLGGNDGSTVTGADHLSALAALELLGFSVLAPYDVTDPAIQASYLSWVQAQDDANRPVRCVLGGAADETVDDALARTQLLEDPHVINFGVGTWHDDLLDKDLSTSQLAPRIAGSIAALGQSNSLTAAKFGGIHAVGNTGPDDDSVEAAVTGGVVTFMRATAPDADVRIAKGVTTFTSTTDVARPLDVFGDVRLIGILDNYVREMKEWGDDKVIGKPINDDLRASVRGKARQLEDDLLRDGLILPGDNVNIPKPWVTVTNTDNDPELNDAIPYQFGWQFAHTANAILGEGLIR